MSWMNEADKLLADLSAKIQHPPRDLKASLSFLKKDAHRVLRLLNEYNRMFGSDEDSQEDREEILRFAGFGWGVDETITRILGDIIKAAEQIENQLDVARGSSEFAGWATSTIEHILNEYGAVTQLDRVARDQREDADPEAFKDRRQSKYYNTPDKAYTLAKRFLAAFLGYVKSTRPRIERMKYAIEEMDRTAGMYEHDERLRPPSEKTEKLYHATTNARKIHSKGFDPRVPTGGGIGGSQTTKSGKAGISFTSDLHIAKNIAAILKELSALLQGKYKLSALLRDMKKDGSYDKVVEQWERDVGHSLPPKNPSELYQLYDKWLWYSKKKFNPVFFGSPADMFAYFKKANLNDIGVVEAEVDMTHKDIEYLRSMHEYRVPPEAVVKVTKLIR